MVGSAVRGLWAALVDVPVFVAKDGGEGWRIGDLGKPPRSSPISSTRPRSSIFGVHPLLCVLISDSPDS